MILIFNTRSSNEDWNGNCDYAIVDLTPNLARLALKRIDYVRALKRKDKHVSDITFWDYSAEYAEYFDEIEEYPELAGVDLIRHAETVNIPEGKQQATACFRMVVYDDGVYWEACPKYSSVVVSTEGVPVRILQAAAKMGRRK